MEAPWKAKWKCLEMKHKNDIMGGDDRNTVLVNAVLVAALVTAVPRIQQLQHDGFGALLPISHVQ